MTDEIDRCYRVLELEPGATLDQVKQGYRELVKVWHPDRFAEDPKLQSKSQERLKEINLAHDTLLDFLTSRTPPGSRQASSQSSDIPGEQKRQRPASETERGEAPPPPGSKAPTSSEPNKSQTGLVWVVVVALGLIAILLIRANSGANSGRSTSLGSISGGTQSGGIGSGYTPPPAYIPPVAKALDDKNGFKDFKFGMTPGAARAVLPPSDFTEKLGAEVTTFHYRATPANRIGEFTIDSLSLDFFHGHLFRIDLRFSNSQDEILEIFKVNFGEPFDADSWKRGDQTLRAKSWQGEKVSAAILALPGQAWDSAVIYDLDATQKALEYAASEPERAASDFGPSGFKSLITGMRFQDLTVEFVVLKEDPAAGTKKVVFPKGDWRSVGLYPLRTLSGDFFQDRLYRIELGFEENRKEMFEAFKHRFGPLQDDESWTRGSRKIKAMSSGNDKLFATILAYVHDEDSWDAIVLLDRGLWKEAEKFRQDASKRAAKDF